MRNYNKISEIGTDSLRQNEKNFDRIRQMELEKLIDAQCVIPKLSASSKKQALRELSQCAAEHTGQSRQIIFDALLEREQLGTTGVGGGVAIPHGKLASLENLYGLFARLETPIDFESIDEKPVDLIFLLLAPELAGADHLKTLSRVSRLLQDKALCEKLRGCDSCENLLALITKRTPFPVN